MPLSGYGVLTAQAVESRREDDARTPHFQVRVTDDEGTAYRIAVNVRSQQSPPDLLYLVDADLHHPVTAQLAGAGRAAALPTSRSRSQSAPV